VPVTLQEVFRAGFAEYARERLLPHHVRQAARRIIECRTPAQGRHVRICPNGHVAKIYNNSCRHRSCPQCCSRRNQQWIEARHQQLLPCDHYHVIFTVAHELVDLWRANRARFNDMLFSAVRRTLLELLGAPKYLGAQPGILAALHSWGRTLQIHPHVHALVCGGGWDGARWKAVRNGYLLPVRVVRALFRGKLLAAVREQLAAQALRLPYRRSMGQVLNSLRQSERKKWNVHVRERYGYGEGVVCYLGRYLRGGPVRNSQLLPSASDAVRFRYTDHRDGLTKTLELERSSFIGRTLAHVPEPRRHLVRYWGLYARGHRALRDRIRSDLIAERAARLKPGRGSEKQTHPERSPAELCPMCRAPLQFFAWVSPRATGPPGLPRTSLR
jgi:hypothetical protein